MANLVLVPSDRELVERARRGDHEAFGQLAQKHRPLCLALVRNLLGNSPDAEDQVQIALLKAFLHLDQFRNHARFSTWLAEIVIRQAKMHLRSLRRRRSVPLATLPPLLLPVSHFPNPESQYRLTEWRQLVRHTIARIHPLYRPALHHDLDELSIPAIAHLLRISVPCAKSRLFRARALLRSHLSQTLFLPPRRP